MEEAQREGGNEQSVSQYKEDAINDLKYLV
jgi:hypothetical protein